MTRGYVTSFDARRGVGFVRQAHGADRIPFAARDSDHRSFQAGDTVEFAVIGGKAGVRATSVRGLAREER